MPVMIGIVVFLAWSLYRALRDGVTRGKVGPEIRVSDSPIRYWISVGVGALALLFFTFVLIHAWFNPER